jgi:hypothetical protein
VHRRLPMRREKKKREKKTDVMETRSVRLKGQATGGVKGRDWQRLQQERGKGERLGRPRYNKQPPALSNDTARDGAGGPD